MQLEPFYVPYAGNGMVIGLNAVIHVVISHGLAIGGMAMLGLGLRSASHGANPVWNAFLKNMVTFLTIMLTGFGAVTGAGIWFTTTAVR